MIKIKRITYKKTIGLIISLAFIAYIAINWEFISDTLRNLSWKYLSLVIIGQAGIQFFNALLLRSTVEPLEKEVGIFEAFRLTTVASFINFFTPVVGGAGVRALYLKAKHGLAYSTFIGVVYANYLIIFLVSFMLGLLSLFFVPGALSEEAGKIVALFFLAGIAASALFMAAGHKLIYALSKRDFRRQFTKKVAEQIALADKGWRTIRKRSKTLYLMGLWSVCTMLSVVLVYWAAMKSIGLEPTLAISIIYAALAIVGLLFNVTPGSIGIRETVFAAVYSFTAITAQQVVAFSLVDRTVQMLMLGAGWIFFNQAIMKRKEHQ